MTDVDVNKGIHIDNIETKIFIFNAFFNLSASWSPDYQTGMYNAKTMSRCPTSIAKTIF